jgi:hypothetical protein
MTVDSLQKSLPVERSSLESSAKEEKTDVSVHPSEKQEVPAVVPIILHESRKGCESAALPCPILQPSIRDLVVESLSNEEERKIALFSFLIDELRQAQKRSDSTTTANDDDNDWHRITPDQPLKKKRRYNRRNSVVLPSLSLPFQDSL